MYSYVRSVNSNFRNVFTCKFNSSDTLLPLLRRSFPSFAGIIIIGSFYIWTASRSNHLIKQLGIVERQLMDHDESSASISHGRELRLAGKSLDSMAHPKLDRDPQTVGSSEDTVLFRGPSPPVMRPWSRVRLVEHLIYITVNSALVFFRENCSTGTAFSREMNGQGRWYRAIDMNPLRPLQLHSNYASSYRGRSR